MANSYIWIIWCSRCWRAGCWRCWIWRIGTTWIGLAVGASIRTRSCAVRKFQERWKSTTFFVQGALVTTLKTLYRNIFDIGIVICGFCILNCQVGQTWNKEKLVFIHLDIWLLTYFFFGLTSDRLFFDNSPSAGKIGKIWIISLTLEMVFFSFRNAIYIYIYIKDQIQEIKVSTQIYFSFVESDTYTYINIYVLHVMHQIDRGIFKISIDDFCRVPDKNWKPNAIIQIADYPRIAIDLNHLLIIFHLMDWICHVCAYHRLFSYTMWPIQTKKYQSHLEKSLWIAIVYIYIFKKLRAIKRCSRGSGEIVRHQIVHITILPKKTRNIKNPKNQTIFAKSPNSNTKKYEYKLILKWKWFPIHFVISS